MMYKAEVAVCSEICKKHSKQSEHHVEFLRWIWFYIKKLLGFKRLNHFMLVVCVNWGAQRVVKRTRKDHSHC
jgi:hypothetical protein